MGLKGSKLSQIIRIFYEQKPCLYLKLLTFVYALHDFHFTYEITWRTFKHLFSIRDHNYTNSLYKLRITTGFPYLLLVKYETIRILNDNIFH
jgi:hypothetical protein